MEMNQENTDELAQKLGAPFPAADVGLKVQATSRDDKSGLIVAYIDARDVMDRLDAVAGVTNWSDAYHVARADGKTCEVGCQLTVAGVTKEDVGDGNAIKDAYSDALKRTAVKFGIGRYLYRLPKVWGAIDQYSNIKNPEDIRKKLGLYDAERTAGTDAGTQQRRSEKTQSTTGGADAASRSELMKEVHTLGRDLYPDGEWQATNWPAIQNKYGQKNLETGQLENVLHLLREREREMSEAK